MKDIDPENLETFHIPESVLSELFELTGESESNRGFLLASCRSRWSSFYIL